MSPHGVEWGPVCEERSQRLAGLSRDAHIHFYRAHISLADRRPPAPPDPPEETL